MTDFSEQESQYTEQSSGTSDGYARIYWMNGEPRVKTPGRFWAFPDRLAEAGITVGAPWSEPQKHAFKDGNEKPLHFARALRLAPICWRQQNFIKDDEGGVATWLEPGKRGKFGPGEAVFFEMLAIVEGLSEPVVFSTKSIKAAMAFLANILPDYRKVRDAIKAERGGRAVPPWWFWLAIRSAVDPQTKEPVYEKTSGSMVTPPIWVMPPNLESRETWKTMYVGSDLAAVGEAAWLAARDWASRPISEGFSAQGAEEAAPAGGRNVPQAVTDANLPF